jgi:hypothetical protein
VTYSVAVGSTQPLTVVRTNEFPCVPNCKGRIKALHSISRLSLRDLLRESFTFTFTFTSKYGALALSRVRLKADLKDINTKKTNPGSVYRVQSTY